MESSFQPGKIDVVPDRNPRQETVAGRELGMVRIDVDHNQSRGAAGDTDPKVRMLSPPVVDPLSVQGGRVEPVAGTACGKAWASIWFVRGRTAVNAVGGRGLTAGRQWVYGPSSAGAPAGDGQRATVADSQGPWVAVRKLQLSRH